MIENLPKYISLVFGVTTLATLLLFIWTIKCSTVSLTRKKAVSIFFGLIVWLVIQSVLTISNLYNTNTNTFPPKIMLLGILPTIFAFIILFFSKNGRKFIDSLPLKNLTYLNVIRVPVEIVLYLLFVNGAVPLLMTFEGRNFDIVAGFTAPFVAYCGFKKGVPNKNLLLIWNFICLGLLGNIIVNALLSTPSPFQKFGFDQPNIAILNFPFSLLPTFIVPIVLFGHLVSIRQLLKIDSATQLK